MTAHEMSLAGFVSPVNHNVGFKIPIFRGPVSNYLLVQDTDNRGIITSFRPFTTNQSLEETEIQISKKVGQQAFWYFGISRSEAIYGSLNEVTEIFRRKKWIRQKLPYVALQIVFACGITHDNRDVLRSGFQQIEADAGREAAQAWLDTWLTAVARKNVQKYLLRRPRDYHSYVSLIQVISESVAQICVPRWIYNRLSANMDARRMLIEEVQQEAEIFDLYVTSDIAMLPNPAARVRSSGINSDVDASKLMIIEHFAQMRKIALKRTSKSYFESEDGHYKVVCTLSRRYEGKGKRKYWYGFHEIWNKWLQDAPQAYVLLGCRDNDSYYCVPLKFFRDRLSALRHTGEGKDKYWHIDIVSSSDGDLRVDVPGRADTQNVLSQSHHFR